MWVGVCSILPVGVVEKNSMLGVLIFLMVCFLCGLQF